MVPIGWSIGFELCTLLEERLASIDYFPATFLTWFEKKLQEKLAFCNFSLFATKLPNKP